VGGPLCTLPVRVEGSAGQFVGYFVSVTGGVITALSAQLAQAFFLFFLGMPRSFVGLYFGLLFGGSAGLAAYK